MGVLTQLRRGTAITAAFVGLLCGCSTFQMRPQFSVDQDAEVAGLASLYSAKAISDCLTQPIAKQATCRNTIVQARLIAIDARYTQFRQAFDSQTRWAAFGSTVVSLGLTSASSLTPVGTAHILGAAASGVTGSQAAYQKEVLVERTANAVETSMDAGRLLISVRIRSGLKQSAADYPLAVALSDLEDYYNAGTMLGAISNITQNAGTQAQVANQELLTVSGFESSSAATYLQNYIDPSIVTDQPTLTQHMNDLIAQVAKLGLNVAPTYFVTNGDPGQQRTVATKLGWNGQ